MLAGPYSWRARLVPVQMLFFAAAGFVAAGGGPGAGRRPSVTAVVVASLMLVFRAPMWAATLAEAGLLFLGAYGILIALFWPAMPGYLYGVVRLDDPAYGPSLGGFPGALVRMHSMHGAILGGGVQGSLLLAAGLWLVPRVIAERRTAPELAARLTQRVADRGLGDAVRALALDAPLPVQIDVDLPGEVELPVATAVYFCVAETLANVAKHAAARTARVRLGYQGGLLRAQITDDGSGGADPAPGTGLAGVERRLATFDGVLAVSRPPGGPTIVVIEVPCALSSARTSSR